ncbi:MAG TPA: 50S ribosomal protein L22 [bacterium]|nr:50S ribosomal protein L22 [bacterium]
MEQASALLRFERVSFRKMKPVADLIRHRTAEAAERVLMVSPRRTARIMLKLLRSAIANAGNNPKISDAASLFVSRVDLGAGPTEKRARFRARGRVFLIRHRRAHVRIVLEEPEAELDAEKVKARGSESKGLVKERESRLGSES